MLLLKICLSEWKNESRDKRELSLCQKLGFKTIVLAKGQSEDKGRIDINEGYEIHRHTTKPFANYVPNFINKVFSLILWAKYASNVSPDVISGHDLGALFIGWLSNFFRKTKAKLVYDSHEFELGRNTKRNKIQLFLIKQLERFLIKRSAFSIMVNESIANEVERIYSLKTKPVVVRNISSKWLTNKEICNKVHNNLVDNSKTCLLLYHGAITTNRGLETLIDDISKIDNIKLLLLGNAQNPDYLNCLKNRVKTFNCEKKIEFHPAVPIADLWQYVGAADICICPDIPNPPKSYFYMLPNKFFESIQSETPIIAGNFPEIIKIINEFKIGKIYDYRNKNSLKTCINEIFYNKKNYSIIKKNLKRAKECLSWEKEQEKLIKAYKNLF
jgi:glycosyltransferase involved in cell wall biosynthesis